MLENKNMEFEYVGFGKRVIASLIDIIIFFPLAIIAFLVYRYSISTKQVIPLVISYIFSLSLFVFLVVKFGGTPGKLIKKTKIVNDEGNNLNVIQATMRILLYIIACADVIFLKFFYQESLVLGNIDTFVGFIILLDVLFILFNSKKRALHDYLAGSYVIVDPAKIKKEAKLSYKEELVSFNSALDRYLGSKKDIDDKNE